MEIKSAALIGVGAVGSYFAYGLPAKLGDRFCVIASGKRKERLEKEGIYINGARCPLNLKTAQEAGKVDLVLVVRRSRLHFLRLWMISAHLWVRIRLS